MSLQVFPRFLDLPKELQIQIWHHAIDEVEVLASVDLTIQYCLTPPGHFSDIYPFRLFRGPRSGLAIYGDGDIVHVTYDEIFSFMKACRLSRLLVLRSERGGWCWDDHWVLLDVLQELIDQCTGGG